MTPDYALSLSFNGIALLARAATHGGPDEGWYALGDVALDVDDLAGALSVLREEATVRAGMAGPEVKLILPNEQIKYLSVPRDDRDSMLQAEAALEGATPYAVADLVFDWDEADRLLHVAAVARETLDEAEAFARDHGFVPVGFVAIAPDAQFAREPFFGPTQTALTDLAPGTNVRPDARQVTVIPGAPPPRGPISFETERAETPLDAGDQADAADHAHAADGTVTVETAVPSDTQSDAEDKAENAAGEDAATQDGKAALVEEPGDAEEALDTQVRAAEPDLGKPASDAPRAPAAPAAPRTLERAPEGALEGAAKGASDGSGPSLPSPRDVPEGVKPLTAEPDAPAPPPVAFASLRADRNTGPRNAPPEGARTSAPDPLAEGRAPPVAPVDAPERSPERPAGADAPDTAARDVAPRPGASGDAQPASPAAPTFAQAIKARAQESLAARDTPVRPSDQTGRASVATTATPTGAPADLGTGNGLDGRGKDPVPGRSVGNVLARAQSGLGRGIGFMSRRNGDAGDAVARETASPRAPAGGAAAALAAENKMDEAERMTVFGARRNAKAQVGGKPRFLGLILTAALLLVLLAVAAWASIFVDDGVARLFRDTGERAPVETALSEPRLPAESAVETSGLPSEAPQTPEEATATLALPETVPEVSDTVLPEVGAPLDGEAEVAALSTGLPAIVTPPLLEPDGLARPLGAEALSPEEAEARYAATGIWQRSPLPPMELRQGLLGDVTIAARDRSPVTPEPSRLSTPASLVTDVAPPVQGLPPRADERFVFDSRGLIRPAPDGVVTPDGYTLVLGRPDILPPARPGAAQPEVPEAPTGSDADTAGTSSDPQVAPEAPIDPGAPADDTAATEGAPPPPIVADPALAGFRPLARPPGLAPAPQAPAQEVLPEEEAAAPLAAEEVAPGSVGLAAFAGVRPAARPPEIAARFAPVAAARTADATADAVPDDAPQAADDAPQASEAPPPPTSRLAVLQSAAPELRPRNMAAIVRRTDRVAEPAPTRVVATVAPRTVTPPAPSRQSVSRAATQNNAINLRRVNLIGVYGKPSDRRALVRLANGRFQKVKVGDRLDGGRILAISDDQLRYQKGGRNVVLDLPQG